MKKLLSLLLALTMIFALAAVSAPSAAAAEPVKAGFIFLHDENSTYDLNFIKAAREACEKLGVEYLFKTGIPEGQECADAAEELIDEGWTVHFYNLDELRFGMTCGVYSYDITFEGKIQDPEDFNEDTDMGGLTVKTITCDGIGDATYMEMPEE
jgi:hypothetical protein